MKTSHLYNEDALGITRKNWIHDANIQMHTNNTNKLYIGSLIMKGVFFV